MRKIKENDCGIARIESNDFSVWSQGDNQKIWYWVVLNRRVAHRLEQHSYKVHVSGSIPLTSTCTIF